MKASSVKKFIAAQLLLITAQCVEVTAEGNDTKSLANLDLEQLMNLEITSVSKKEEKLTDAPAAIYVLTQDDIRRSGVTSIPEVLRQVPGLSVGRFNASTWSVTARGFTNQYANKLLVLIDGRSVYTPLYSGVFWDVQDLPLENIERIEVIRGPGATLWGANAVNGVINIITKSTTKDPGTLVTTGGGKEEKSFGTLQYTGKAGENSTYRVYGKYNNRDAFKSDLDRPNNNDSWEKLQTGFRFDTKLSNNDMFTVQGDTYSLNSNLSSFIIDPTARITDRSLFDSYQYAKGGNLLMRYSGKTSNDTEYQIQSYFDRTIRDITPFREDRNTIDVDTQFRLQITEHHDLIAGAGYRNTGDNIKDATPTVIFDPLRRNDNLFSGFLQDEITLLPEKLKLTVGSKFEHNDYTGYELQPGARISWKMNSQSSLWGSISRSIRIPSRAEHSVQLPISVLDENSPENLLGIPLVSYLRGDKFYNSENLMSYEVGYKSEFAKNFYFDVTAFVKKYINVQSVGTPEIEYITDSENVLSSRTYANVLFPFRNKGNFTAYGFEYTSKFSISPNMTWKNNYSFYLLDASPTDELFNYTETSERTYPRHSAQSILSYNLFQNCETDFMFYYYDNISGGRNRVRPNLKFDSRIGYKITPQAELSFVAQNLFKSEQIETLSDTTSLAMGQNERAYYGKLEIRF
jgi:iron complex outermembrane recepter protein